MKLLSFGEIIWDVYGESKVIGGAPFNFAAHASICKDDAYLLSSVGDDELGRAAICEAEELKINTKYTSVDPSRITGECRVSLDENGVPSFDITDDVAYDKLTVDPDVVKEGFDLIAYGTLALRTDGNRKLLSDLIASGVAEKTFLDLNLRAPFYTKETVVFALERANVLKMNEDELLYVSREITDTEGMELEITLRRLSELYRGLEIVVVTYGAFGSYGYDCRTRELISCPARRSSVVSTVGAGDCFSAVFLSSYYKGEDIRTCLKLASEKSARVVASDKAIPDEMRIRSAFIEMTDGAVSSYGEGEENAMQIYLGGVFPMLEGGVWTPYLMKIRDGVIYVADEEGMTPVLAFHASMMHDPEFKMENGNLWLHVGLDDYRLVFGMSRGEWKSKSGRLLLSLLTECGEVSGMKHYNGCTGRMFWLYRILHL